ncbi:MAG: hypothetical protein AAF654_03570, partial [Myxococcota bacterium]
MTAKLLAATLAVTVASTLIHRTSWADVDTSEVSRIAFSPDEIPGTSGEAFQAGGNAVSLVQSRGTTNYFFAQIVGNKNALLAETNGTTEILMGPAEVNPRLAVDPGRIRQFQVTATGV